MIYIELNTDMEVVHVHYSRQSVLDKYGKPILDRVYGVMKRSKGLGFTVKEHFWAKLPSDTKMEDINRKAKQQVKDLYIRFLMNKYSKMDLSSITYRDKNELLYTMKQVLVNKLEISL
jgi:hypothetical protein